MSTHLRHVPPVRTLQGRIFDDRRSPEEIIEQALQVEGPVVRTVCLFSGGGDSIAVAYRCRDRYDELVHINTGTAFPGVEHFVRSVAKALGKPLRVYHAGNAYERLVLGDVEWWRWYGVMRRRWARKGYPEHALDVPTMIRLSSLRGRRPGDGKGNGPQGFPGPAGGHGIAYVLLKERQIEALIRDLKREFAPNDRFARVALLSGARIGESARRARNQAGPGWRSRGAQLWINPLNEWTNDEVRAYRHDNDLPISDVAALMHRSGECNCGAYIAKHERQFTIAFFAGWYEQLIAPLERWASCLGVPRCRWGERTDTGRPGARGATADILEPPGELCSSCVIQQLAIAAECEQDEPLPQAA